MPRFEKCARYTRARDLMAGGRYPFFVPIEDSEATEVAIGGRRVLMLGSNNYLGLTHDPRVVAAARAALERFGTGCTGSRFLNGNLALHEELEAEIADFLHTEAALVFSTGYQANLGVITGLCSRDARVFLDKCDHASIVDGCLMAHASVVRFGHGRTDELAAKLAADRANGHHGAERVVVVDGVFSMEGDVADLPAICALCEEHGAALLVDEAHAVGVMGPTGAGTAEHFGLLSRVDVVIGTFSKSLASIGGFCAASGDVIHYLRHNARPLMFSASLPPASAAAALEALRIVRAEPERRELLWSNARRFAQGLRELGFEIGPTETPIVPVYTGSFDRTLELWRALFDAGVYTNPIAPPAVPEGTSRLRTSCVATHTPEQIERALEIFGDAGRKLGFVR